MKGAACKFRTHMRETSGLMYDHITELSKAFPQAVFLMELYDMESSNEKTVFHGGRLLRATFDNSPHVQGGIWALLNIFTPFMAEYESGLPVGSLWDEWMNDVIAAAHALRTPAAYATEPPEPLDVTFAD